MRYISVLMVMLLAGCAASEKVPARNVVFTESKENQRFDNSALTRQIFDMNNDGRVDVWKFYETKRASDEDQGETYILRKELDLNFDGTIDRIMYYNQKEELVREEIDSNFDEIIDRIQYYDNALVVKTEIYTAECNTVKIDGKDNKSVHPNKVRYYRKGILTREEYDEKCDGVSESVTIFNETGGISQTGYDDDANGVIEEWIRY